MNLGNYVQEDMQSVLLQYLLWKYGFILVLFAILGNSLSILQILLFFHAQFLLQHYLKTEKELHPDELSCIGIPRIHAHIPQTSICYLCSLCVLWATLPQLVWQLSINFIEPFLIQFIITTNYSFFSYPFLKQTSCFVKKSAKFIVIFIC